MPIANYEIMSVSKAGEGVVILEEDPGLNNTKVTLYIVHEGVETYPSKLYNNPNLTYNTYINNHNNNINYINNSSYANY